MRNISFTFITISSLFLSGCSSVFYYPDQNMYVDTTKLKHPPEELQIPAKDGHLLTAWHFPSQKKKTKALILHFHGNAQNISSHFAFLATAPGNGYAHLIFDYRGYGATKGEPTPENTVSDSRDVLFWAKAKYPELPLVVFGQSLGGAIVLRSLVELKDEFRADAIVIDSSFSSYRSVARSVMAKHWLTWLFQPLAWLIVDNSKGPGKDIAKLPSTPFLVVHGDKDHIVDLSNGKSIYELAPEPKNLWIVKGGQHTDFMMRKKFRDKFYVYLDKIFGKKKTAN